MADTSVAVAVVARAAVDTVVMDSCKDLSVAAETAEGDTEEASEEYTVVAAGEDLASLVVSSHS